MNKNTVFIFLLFAYSAHAIYERDIPKELVEDQRKYSSEAIYEMIKFAKVDGKDCNIRIKKNIGSFVVKQNGHNFSYSNVIYEGDLRRATSYDCLLTPTKDRLECKRRLPGLRMGQDYDDFIYTTIFLDEAGQATSMEGKKVRKPVKGVFNFLARKKTITRFKCEILSPAKVSEKEVNDKKRSRPKAGSFENTNGESIKSTTKGVE